MKNFIAKAVVTLAAGSVITLTEKQAKDRLPRLEPLKEKGWYRTRDALQIKAGESFGYEGELPRSIAGLVEQPKDAKPEAKAPDPGKGKGKK